MLIYETCDDKSYNETIRENILGLLEEIGTTIQLYKIKNILDEREQDRVCLNTYGAYAVLTVGNDVYKVAYSSDVYRECQISDEQIIVTTIAEKISDSFYNYKVYYNNEKDYFKVFKSSECIFEYTDTGLWIAREYIGSILEDELTYLLSKK